MHTPYENLMPDDLRWNSFIPKLLGLWKNCLPCNRSLVLKRLGTAVVQARWLTPVIPALWEDEVVYYLMSEVRDQPDQSGETLSLLKIQKLARHGGVCL